MTVSATAPLSPSVTAAETTSSPHTHSQFHDELTTHYSNTAMFHTVASFLHSTYTYFWITWLPAPAGCTVSEWVSAKFDFDPTTWVVWANSQFATVWVSFFFPFFFCFYWLAYKSRRRMNRHRSTLIRRVLCQGCAFWGLEYSIFTFLPIFHQKSSKWSLK